MNLVSKTGALVEAINRKGTDGANKVELTAGFGPQNEFVNDTSRYIVAQCSRRSGKSNGLVLRFFKTMEKHPKSNSLYVGLTQESAREIIWPVFKEMDDKYKIGCKYNESQMKVTHPNGASVKLVGADRKDFIKKLRGKKHPAVAIDEAQDLTTLQTLIDDVLTPCIADYEDGWLALTGTPGPVPMGYFFDITENQKFGYSVHKWTLLENPYMPNPEAFIEDLCLKREWTQDNPTLRREWRNQWVLDAKSLWVQYSEQTNDFKELPKEHKWNYLLGVDIGFMDADAIAVVAWSETTKDTYLVEEIIARKQGVTALMDMINKAQTKYQAYKIVMDEGGLGKKVAEDFRSRYGMPVHAADKAHKQSNVELLNDALRLGRFRARADGQFAKDSYLVQIDWDKSTPQKIVIKKKPHSDIIDAVLYAFRESYAHTYIPPSPKLKWGTKEWADAQSSIMWEAEMEGHQKANELAKYDLSEYE